MDEPLAEEILLTRRHKEPVDNDVIDELRPHCARKPDVVHLDRCRPEREDRSPAGSGVAIEIYQDIDVIGVNELGCLTFCSFVDVDEPIEGTYEASAHRILVVWPGRVTGNVEAPT